MIEVILLEKVGRFGQFGDVVKVKNGFARNYLIPYAKALPATKSNRLRFEQERQTRLAEKSQQYRLLQEKAQSIAALGTLIVSAKAGAEGKLFGGIAAKDIAKALEQQAAVLVTTRDLVLPEKSLKQLGDYEILFKPAGQSALDKAETIAQTFLLSIVATDTIAL